MARRIKANPSSVVDWEAGRHCPSLNRAIQLADLYGVTLDQLTGRAPLPVASPVPATQEGCDSCGEIKPGVRYRPGMQAMACADCAADVGDESEEEEE